MKKFLFVLLLIPMLSQAQFIRDSLSFWRPLNATAYANGDIMCALTDSAVLRFPKFGAYLNGSFIVGASIEVDTPSTTGLFRLWLFKDTTDFVKIGDNAAWVAPATMMRAHLLGYLDFSLSSLGLGAGSGGNAVFTTGDNTPIVGIGKNGVFAILTAAGAYTPKHGGRITLRLIGYQP
jgi:hypothetical protein